MSPIEDALIFVKPLPSPLNKDADTEPVILREPVICVLPLMNTPFGFTYT
jgi:hypothetical protein